MRGAVMSRNSSIPIMDISFIPNALNHKHIKLVSNVYSE